MQHVLSIPALTDLPREGHPDYHSDGQGHGQLGSVGKVAAGGLTHLYTGIYISYEHEHGTCMYVR